jgi:hypothetical protein
MDNRELAKFLRLYLEMSDKYLETKIIKVFGLVCEIDQIKLAATKPTIIQLHDFYGALETYRINLREILRVVKSSHLKNKLMMGYSETFYTNFLVLNDKIGETIGDNLEQIEKLIKTIADTLDKKYHSVKDIESVTADNFGNLHLSIISRHNPDNAIIRNKINKSTAELMNVKRVTCGRNFSFNACRYNLIPYKNDDLVKIFTELNAKFNKEITYLKNIAELGISTLVIIKRGDNVYNYGINRVYLPNEFNTTPVNTNGIINKYIISKINPITKIKPTEGLATEMIFTDKKSSNCVIFEFLCDKFIRVLTDVYDDISISQTLADRILSGRSTLPKTYNKDALMFQYRDEDFSQYYDIFNSNRTIIKYQFENLRHVVNSYVDKKYSNLTPRELKATITTPEFATGLKFLIFDELGRDSSLFSNELHISLMLCAERVGAKVCSLMNKHFTLFFKPGNTDGGGDELIKNLFNLSKRVFEEIQLDRPLYDAHMRNLKVIYMQQKNI